MKYTTYNTVAQITTQNAEKYQSDRGKLESTCLLACSPCVSQKIVCVSLLKNVLLFLTNETMWFISFGIVCSCFSGNLLVSFLLRHNFETQFKSKGGDYIFMSSITC